MPSGLQVTSNGPNWVTCFFSENTIPSRFRDLFSSWAYKITNHKAFILPSFLVIVQTITASITYCSIYSGSLDRRQGEIELDNPEFTDEIQSQSSNVFIQHLRIPIKPGCQNGLLWEIATAKQEPFKLTSNGKSRRIFPYCGPRVTCSLVQIDWGNATIVCVLISLLPLSQTWLPMRSPCRFLCSIFRSWLLLLFSQGREKNDRSNVILLTLFLRQKGTWISLLLLQSD